MEKEKKEFKSFDDFTNLYELSKTLRFELKPVGKTADFLKVNKVFEKDQTIDDSYNQAKFYFDKLHQKFIDSALAEERIKNLLFGELADFLTKKNEGISIKRKILNEMRKNNDNDGVDLLQKEINKIEDEIKKEKDNFYKNIRALFDIEAENWKKQYDKKILGSGDKIEFSKADKKQKGVKFLTSAGILQVLKYEFPQSKENEFKKDGFPSLSIEERENPGKNRYIFDSFNKFSGYLSKFQQTRDNLYADDGTSTAVATRILSNFDIFLANRKTFKDRYEKNCREIGFDETDIFEINNYYNYLLQSGIEALDGYENSQNSYNKIIGGINKQIKEYRDKKASEAKQDKDKNFKKSIFPLFKTLEKQILGKVEKEKQLIEKTRDKTEEEVFFEKFEEFISDNKNRFKKAEDFMAKFFNDEFSFAYENVYVKNTTINTISRRWFADAYNFERNLPQTSSKDKKETDTPKVKKFISIEDIKNAVEQLEGKPFKQTYYDKNIVSSEQELWKQFLTVWKNEFESLFRGVKREDDTIIIDGYGSTLSEANKLKFFSRKRDDRKKEIDIIKNYADASLSVFQMMKYLALDGKDRDKTPGQINTDFYAELDEYTKDFNFIKYYNAFRNFITKKPFSEEKIKLNFEKNPPILKGFSKQYSSYLLKKIKDGRDEFYLGILDFGEIDETIKIKKQSEYFYFPATQLKFQNLVNKAFESCFGYVYSKEVNESKAVIDAQQFIKERHLSKYPELKKLVENRFSSKAEFSKEANRICLDIYSKNTFYPLDKSQVEDRNDNGELYLFKIINKDWSEHKKDDSMKNVHTLYFERLFSKENLKQPIMKISGGSEMFSRDETEEIKKDQKHIITKENKKDITKFLKDKFSVEKYVYNRYMERKYFLHLSMVLNYGKQKTPQDRDKLVRFVGGYNKKIRKELHNANKSIHIIGIDRGEKNLLYYSVVNQKGEILDQGSLNKINEVNYHEKLVAREKERLENRRSWQEVAKIKDLKKGYISHVIHKICELIIKHNAIIVLEDLNMRFKQIRGGIERSVYQQFEKALIDKLGYLVFKRDSYNPEKSLDLHGPGGVLNGYQLSAPFVSFEKMGKQTGVIFYTQADYTSITDPLTGFRKNIYISNSASKEKIKEAIRRFKAIGWDKKEKSYFFTYNPTDFVDEKYKGNTFSKEWTVYAKVSRIRREKDTNGYWTYEEIDLNKEFGELFKIWEIRNIYAEDFQDEVLQKMEDGELGGEKEFDGKKRSFYHAFIYLFNLILQLRNSYSKQFKTKEEGEKVIVEEIGEDIDFIASPVKPFFSTLAKNKNGEELSLANFDKFNKKVIAENKEKILNDFNGDANGAYNIARKGIMILTAIGENPEKPDLYISKYNWDETTTKWAKENGVE